MNLQLWFDKQLTKYYNNKYEQQTPATNKIYSATAARTTNGEDYVYNLLRLQHIKQMYELI